VVMVMAGDVVMVMCAVLVSGLVSVQSDHVMAAYLQYLINLIMNLSNFLWLAS